MSADFTSIVQDQDVELLAEGFRVAEGPVWLADRGFLVFHDFMMSRRLRWDQERGISLISDGANRGNGQTLDRDGRLIVCERTTRSVVREEIGAGRHETLVDRFEGQRLNSPNKVVVRSNGDIYFTDPHSPNSSLPDSEQELDFVAVFRYRPGSGEITVVARDVGFPHGLAFSPDERRLYVSDTTEASIRVYDVESDGSLRTPSDTNLFAFPDDAGEGLADGMTVDIEGNLYCAGPGGVWVLNPKGSPLGIIATPNAFHTNVAFGDDDWASLFITTRQSLFRIRLGIPGLPLPRTRV